MTTSVSPTAPTSSEPVQKAQRVPISYKPQDDHREPKTIEEMIELQKLNESADKFDQLLQVSANKNKHRQNDADDNDSNTSYYGQQNQSDANLLAISSQVYKAPVATTTAPQTVAPTTITTDISELCEKIVAKISISGPALSNKEEVRLLLRNDILPQTEVRVSLDAGSIRINFLSGAQDSYNWLINHQESCANYLNNRLAQPISIDVQRHNDNLADGRSRQRRNLYDEAEKG